MKITPSVDAGARVVLWFDANMPDLRSCRRGCRSDRSHLCRHRFGPWVELIDDPNLMSFLRLNDLQVILFFINFILRTWPTTGTRHNRHFVLMTHDVRFIEAASSAHTSQKNMRHLPFTWAKPYVHFGRGKKRLTVRVQVLPSDGGRDRDVKRILQYARSLPRT